MSEKQQAQGSEFSDGLGDESEFHIFCDGDFVAGCSGPHDSALAEVRQYAYQYALDGVVEIYQIHRTRIA